MDFFHRNHNLRQHLDRIGLTTSSFNEKVVLCSARALDLYSLTALHCYRLPDNLQPRVVTRIEHSTMVGRKKRTKRTSLGNQQRGWLWGRHAVLETLRAQRWQPFEVQIVTDLLEPSLCKEVRQLCQDWNVITQTTTAAELEKYTRARDHQGLAARMPEFPLEPFAEFVSQLPANPFLLILDRIQDPYNFGSMLRSADLFGVDGVVIGCREQAGVSSHVARSSVGAVNYLRITQAESLAEAVRTLQKQGIEIVAASEKGSLAPSEVDLSGRLGILIGNEGGGIAPDLLALSTTHCAIPQSGHVDSLNAAVAAGILCYEANRQRRGTVPR